MIHRRFRVGTVQCRHAGDCPEGVASREDAINLILKRMWQQWTNAILGLAVIIVPFLGLAAGTFTWILAILGIAIAVLALWGAQETHAERERGRMVHRPRHT